jgi:hypothetical protein
MSNNTPSLNDSPAFVLASRAPFESYIAPTDLIQCCNPVSQSHCFQLLSLYSFDLLVLRVQVRSRGSCATAISQPAVHSYLLADCIYVLAHIVLHLLQVADETAAVVLHP